MMSRIRSLLTAAASALVILAAAPASAATELDLQGVVGYDSNVFNLNDSIGERDGLFTDLEAGFSAERDWLGGTAGFDLGLAARLFESSMSDGDETKYFVRLRGDSGGKRKDRAFEWALRYRVQDSTYVSRSTGVVATDGLGNEIGDRFDSSIGDLRGAWNLPGGAFIEGVIETKDYRNDYAALGLDRLDYNQYEVIPGYEAGSRTDTFRIRLPLTLRQYRDRRTSDVNGNSVAGTDLEYRYYGVDARYEHEFTRASALELSGGYEVRNDNGVGYGDRQRWNVAAEWNHRPDTQSRLSAGLEWSSRVLDRPVSGAPVNDETPEKKGYTLNVKYARLFPGVEIRNLALLTEGRWESFDNSNNVLFSYDRLEVFAGIRKNF